MDPDLLAILACPKCRGSLESLKQPVPPPAQEDAEGLSCPACSLVYPIIKGIPVLLVEEGIAAADWPKRSERAVPPR